MVLVISSTQHKLDCVLPKRLDIISDQNAELEKGEPVFVVSDRSFLILCNKLLQHRGGELNFLQGGPFLCEGCGKSKH